MLIVNELIIDLREQHSGAEWHLLTGLLGLGLLPTLSTRRYTATNPSRFERLRR